MIRKAKREDLEKIMTIVQDTVNIMEEEGNKQWSETYPRSSHFEKDLLAGSLFVMEENDEILGSVTIDQKTLAEYDNPNLSWRSEGPFFAFHRLVVNPFTRGKGIASQLMSHAEVIANQNGISYMKTDTYSTNKKAQALFEKNGYQKVGEIFIGEQPLPFYCYDKVLS